MIEIDATATAILSALLALWLASAVAAIFIGLRRDVVARAHAAEIERLTALLAATPGAPMLVGPDGRISAEDRFAAILGLQSVPATLDALASADAGGLAAADAEALRAEIEGIRSTGRPFVRALHLAGTDRVLMAEGRIAPRALGDGLLIWLFDQSEAMGEIRLLSDEAERISDALDSCLALIEAAPFPMWHRGPDLRLALVNSAYVAAVEGVSAEQVVTRGIELIDGSGDAPSPSAARAYESGRISTQIVPVTLGGQRKMMRIVDVPMGAHGVAGYAVDVQELEAIRTELGSFQSAQRDLFDHLSAGVAQFAADRSLVFYNQNFLRLFSIRPEWLKDSPEFDRVLERMRDAQSLPEVRDFPGWKNDRRAWFNAVSAIEENWTLPAGRHVRVVAQPLPNGGLLLLFEDRTEQIQLTSARDTLLRVRAATFDNLFEAIGVFAADGRLTLWNNRFAEMWGLDETDLAQNMRVDALVDKVAARLLDPSRAQKIRDLVRIATVDRQRERGRLSLADGRHFDFAVVPLPDGNALFTLLDITASRGIEEALRERADALEEADRLKTAFVANMSYELRVPLTSIQGFTEMLAGGYAGELPESAGEYVEAVLASVARLASLIEDVLDLTQGAAGQLPLTAELVDVEQLLRDAVEAAGPAAMDRPITLQVELPSQLGTIRGDERRLRQILDHLLENAILYTPPGGKVRLTAEGDEDWVSWRVADTGRGMDSDQQARIFDAYPRIDGTAEDGSRSIGIGLPLTRQLVEAHGGSITLDSEPGQGTVVVIRLPRTVPDESSF
ncbi:sensor histidine kinase [Sphingomonas montanisoli]|uniref:histidine kinase n=1 Tax=Sphingomonas montanisoli TaxID=2606412 RepID=A0A5D9C9T5_9SPHN|nr:PAS domain-containing sensor histidine kinase [Sphingomonas montanisoli]TZG27810.1 PAS domain-containing protein [Sphingomonas montanisoli]